MDLTLMWESLPRLLGGAPLTLQLVGLSLLLGLCIAVGLAVMRLSRNPLLSGPAAAYVFVFRGTPLLVQIFLIYYGLGQFPALRESFAWPFLREAYWCAVLALALNTAAYTSEIIRGGVQSVPFGQIEAARALGMGRMQIYRRIVAPIALRQALPAYGNEIILMVKASSLASTITLLEITGIARRLISQTFAVFEIFIIAGAIYLLMNFVVSRVISLVEWRLTPHLRRAT
ncbi:ABC transporter permease [Arenibaculum pallidiluteum]|uniref:ABC transporter permease n=1 Tax=Arenibaculum pallidiluteum TaxID=2812559 RepID=UPI001A96F148|nr:ABC transporter permease [Arenibaculum pallidiluteum]